MLKHDTILITQHINYILIKEIDVIIVNFISEKPGILKHVWFDFS